jgi:hypothetical protein
MQMEQRGAGLKERVKEIWPDTERTKTMTTGLTRLPRGSTSAAGTFLSYLRKLSLNSSSPGPIIEKERCGKGYGCAERATTRGHP